MDRYRQYYARARAEAPFVIFVFVIYAVGAAFYQLATILAPMLAFLPGPALEVGGFALTFAIARWWYGRFVGGLANPETVDQLTGEIRQLRQDIAALREQRLGVGKPHDRPAYNIVPADRFESARLRLADDAATRQAIARLSGELLRLLLTQGATSLLTRLATPTDTRHDRRG